MCCLNSLDWFIKIPLNYKENRKIKKIMTVYCMYEFKIGKLYKTKGLKFSIIHHVTGQCHGIGINLLSLVKNIRPSFLPKKF